MHPMFNDLKNRPIEERKTLAAGIAIGVMAILFVIWMVTFFARVNSVSERAQFVAAPSVQESVETFTRARESLESGYSDAATELERIRAEAASLQAQAEIQASSSTPETVPYPGL